MYEANSLVMQIGQYCRVVKKAMHNCDGIITLGCELSPLQGLAFQHIVECHA